MEENNSSTNEIIYDNLRDGGVDDVKIGTFRESS